MSNVILKVENLSKQYRLGLVGLGSISDDLKRWWYLFRGKEDPFLKIGEVNNRETKGESDYVWALQDINFEVQRGEVLGIIGKNGAGKSTLLKILSKITGPTTGSVKFNGRIASLLEVGTGFHPEMTGRENVYLNGAILGMTKKEITSKIEEIIDFSGCERYIDTPTKRYSSGMTVRLAFAVAAFLEPDILVIDEVLAVGDAEFQKKAMGKMKDISKGQGRTVLFVSHNMTAVESLCSRVIVLKDGAFLAEGAPEEMINIYLNNVAESNRIFDARKANVKKGNNDIEILYASVDKAGTENSLEELDVSSGIKLRFIIKNKTNIESLSLGCDLKNLKEIIVFGSGTNFLCPKNKAVELVCNIPGDLLNDDLYQVNLYVNSSSMTSLCSEKELLSFEVKDLKREAGYLDKINGVIRPRLKWEAYDV